jgi:ATP-dependent Lon protease
MRKNNELKNKQDSQGLIAHPIVYPAHANISARDASFTEKVTICDLPRDDAPALCELVCENQPLFILECEADSLYIIDDHKYEPIIETEKEYDQRILTALFKKEVPEKQVAVFSKQTIFNIAKDADFIGDNGVRKVNLTYKPDFGADTHILKQQKADTIARIRGLTASHPNFAEVIEYIAAQLSVRYFNSQEIRWEKPILMHGEPGIGKNYFMNALKEILELPYLHIDFSVSGASFDLTGLERGYDSANPGQIFNLFANQHIANPMIMIDEIDKCASKEKHDPMKTLISFLEQENSREYSDKFIRYPIDISHTNWIAAANDISQLPTHILSRFHVFKINNLSREELKGVARNIYANICTRLERIPSKLTRLSDEVVEALILYQPREMQGVLNAAMAKAIQDERLTILVQDVIDGKAHVVAKVGFGFMKSN